MIGKNNMELQDDSEDDEELNEIIQNARKNLAK